MKADQILVIAGGVVAEQGVFAALLARDGMYRDLYETQFRQVIEGEAAAGLNIQALSSDFRARRLTESDIADVYALARSNRHYNRLMDRRPSMARLTKIVTRAPEGSSSVFAGFFTPEDELVAVMDLICGHNSPTCAYVGMFMVEAELQGQGIGSQIVADMRSALAAQGFERLELSCSKRNAEALSFWKNRGFETACESEKAIALQLAL